jgi:hypothetical protein
MAKQAATPVAVGGVLPAYVEWVNYFGSEVQQRVFWISPSAGTYLLETSTDLKTWSPAGTWTPSNEGAQWAEPIYPSDGVKAYRMTRTA